MLTGETGELNAEAARHLVQLRFAPADNDRIEALGGKANQGTLTPEERTELDDYIGLADHLTILQSKSRVLLRHLVPVGSARG